MNDLIIAAYLKRIIDRMVELDADPIEFKILKDGAKIIPAENKLIIQDMNGSEYQLKIERK